MDILFWNGGNKVKLLQGQQEIARVAPKLLGLNWIPYEVDLTGVRPVLRKMKVQAGTETYVQVLASATLERME